MYRTLGLRHLIVVNSRCGVVGIIARAELTQSHLQDCCHRRVASGKISPLFDDMDYKNIQSDDRKITSKRSFLAGIDSLAIQLTDNNLEDDSL